MQKGHYNTKQRDELIGYLQSVPGEHVTVSDIEEHFTKSGSKLGTTTIYRHLEKMVDEGIVKKYVLDSNMPSCFEYIANHNECRQNGCTHLKCTNCGKLIHLHCDILRATESHIYEEHGFRMDMTRTVIYGLCKECQEQ